MARSIDPSTLKDLRTMNGLSMDKLGKMAGVDSQTIYRIENGTHTHPRAGTIAKLSRALGVDAHALSGEGNGRKVDEDDEDEYSVYPKYQVNARIDGGARNSLTFVAKRYGVTISQIIELAPFLFFVAAEKSLREREQKLGKARSAFSAVESLSGEFPHLPENSFNFYQEALDYERRSIGQRDLFGKIVDKAPIHNGETPYDDSTHNPFVQFLTNLAESVSDGAKFNNWPPSGSPDYIVCADEALAVVGNDPDAAAALLRGAALLHEMPKAIRSGPTEPRAAWAKQEAEQLSLTILSSL